MEPGDVRAPKIRCSMTRGEFTLYGLRFVAIRFTRSDIGSRGIEIYTVAPDGLEEPLRLANPAGATALDRLVIGLIDGNISDDIGERYAMIELA